MADKKISDLTDGSPLQSTDDFVIARSGADYKIPQSSLSAAPSGAAGGDLAGTYPDPSIGAGKVTEAKLGLTDVTTADVSTSAHGLTPKLPNDATKFLDGTGSYSTPAGTGSGGDGWMDDTAETWTYASASTFTVGGDKTAKYTSGTKIKLTQSSTARYFVVIGVSYDGTTNTTVTITGGSDYTLANATISANFHSYVENPQGWPNWFNYSPTLVGWAATPTVNTAAFSVCGRTCTVLFDITGTSNSTSTTLGLPITAGPLTSHWALLGLTENGGTIATTPGRISIAAGGTSAALTKDTGGSNAWTASGTKRVGGQFVYDLPLA